MISHQGQVLSTSFEKNWYWYYESLFWPEQIDNIINICESQEVKEGLVESNSTPIHEIRKNKVSWHENQMLFDLVRPILHGCNKDSGWNYNITAIENLQYCVYHDDDNHYDWHTDTLVNDETLNINYPEGHLKNTIRKMTCIIQLSDPKDYEGGRLQLLTANNSKDGFETTPLDLPQIENKGAVFCFPSLLYHRVTPVTKGTRKSLVCWFRGPKWQ